MTLGQTLNEITANKRKVSPYCAFQFLVNSLSKEDKKSLEDAIQKNIPVTLIVKALRKEGHKTSLDAMRAHIKNECRCPKN